MARAAKATRRSRATAPGASGPSSATGSGGTILYAARRGSTRCAQQEQSKISFPASKQSATTGLKRKCRETVDDDDADAAAFEPAKKKQPCGPKGPRGRLSRASDDKAIFTDAVIPAWATLPHSVLEEIFVQAASPPGNQAHQSVNAQWLLHTALVCTSFSGPALRALYKSPPLPRASRIQKFLKCVNSADEQSWLNYKRVVQRLELDVRTIGHRNQLPPLVAHFPNLRHLELPLRLDATHAVGAISRFKYPSDLFTTMVDGGIHLRSWEWNWNFTTDEHAPGELKGLHRLATFRHVEQLTFSYFPSSDPPSQTRVDEINIAEAIHLLPYLRHLCFVECSIVDGELLSRLPRELTSLTLIDCVNVDSDMLLACLETSGRYLKRLVLKHNASLDLAFLPMLAETCPRLEEIVVDCRFWPNFEPNFDILLCPTQVPTWPSTLRSIEFTHLRNWSVEAAEVFLRSLVRAAPQLPDLRRLELKTILNIEWRVRATFRDAWVTRLQKVFLRPAAPPPTMLPSLAAWKEHLAALQRDKRADSVSSLGTAGDLSVSQSSSDEGIVGSGGSSPESGTRRSSRISQLSKRLIAASKAQNNAEPSEPRKLRSRKATQSRPVEISARAARLQERLRAEVKELYRCAGRDRPMFGEPDDAGHTATDNGGDSIDDDHLPTHGLCSHVHFCIDNKRPGDGHFTEADFHDDEREGDEDWTGQDRPSKLG